MKYVFANAEHTIVKRLEDGSTFEWSRHVHPSNIHGFAAERWRGDGCPTPAPFEAPHKAPVMPDDADRRRRRDAGSDRSPAR